MCIVPASNRLSFGAINIFHKCVPRKLNINFARFFLDNSLKNIFSGRAVYLLIGFGV